LCARETVWSFSRGRARKDEPRSLSLEGARIVRREERIDIAQRSAHAGNELRQIAGASAAFEIFEPHCRGVRELDRIALQGEPAFTFANKALPSKHGRAFFNDGSHRSGGDAPAYAAGRF
jgi:hypothetical protein